MSASLRLFLPWIAPELMKSRIPEFVSVLLSTHPVYSVPYVIPTVTVDSVYLMLCVDSVYSVHHMIAVCMSLLALDISIINL